MNRFQELALQYDDWFRTRHGQYVYRYERQAVFELAGVREGMYVADIGCGTGTYADELCSAGARVVGVDISPAMLAVAAEKTRRHGDSVNFVTGDAAALPFDDECFDLVVSVTALEFFEDPRGCLQEMYRVVKPGGRIVAATLNSLSLWALGRRIRGLFAETVFSGARFYGIRDIRTLFLPYRVVDWRGCIHVPPFAPGWLVDRPDRLELWGQRMAPALGAFIAVRVDKE